VSDGDRPPSDSSAIGALFARPGLSYHASRIGLGVALAILTYLLFPAAPATDFPVYEVGSVASDNVIAPVAFTVLKTDKELASERAAVANGVEPVYDYVQTAYNLVRTIDDVRVYQLKESPFVPTAGRPDLIWYPQFRL